MGRQAGARKRQAQIQEHKLLSLIDEKETIRRYQGLLEKIAKGTLDVPAFLKEVSLDAALKVAHLMHSSQDEKVQLSAATDLLDRAGHGKTSKHQFGGTVTVDHDTSKMELINLILSSARKAGIKTKDRDDAMLVGRVVETTAVDMVPDSFVDVLSKTLDETVADPLAPACLGGKGGEDE